MDYRSRGHGSAIPGCDESKLCYAEKACVRVKLEGFAGMRVTCNIAALIDAAILETGFGSLRKSLVCDIGVCFSCLFHHGVKSPRPWVELPRGEMICAGSSGRSRASRERHGFGLLEFGRSRDSFGVGRRWCGREE